MLVNDDEDANSNPVAGSTRCTTDRFDVTNPGGISPPTICGQNTGEHSTCSVSLLVKLESLDNMQMLIR